LFFNAAVAQVTHQRGQDADRHQARPDNTGKKSVAGATGCAPTTSESCRTNSENLTTTKLKTIRAILVRVQAKKVRSVAGVGLGFSPLSFIT